MKKVILIFVFLFVGLSVNAQAAKIKKEVSEAGDVASFELDCSVQFQSLAKGLRYNITRHEFKGPELKNSYRLLLVMDGFYSKTLNKTMTISAVLTDGTIIEAKKIIEDDGFFDGACTLKIKDPKALLEANIDKVIVHADKDVVYTLSAKNKAVFKQNLSNVINAK
ncbi:hypothetical protein FLA105534_03723 [Flavobacterium bizetiae]|uniref:Uncharacterized protein n=1 Tax=Flavobacterium bizetiae TaxID=2704140 RepID=A0A6J4GRM2_9FLAO|nr:hypothetical protein [Flavobacterium bizetiae]CAA9201688.1 hypothetical protein FLA105534_03723 [Flavobacterium bizetiae]CAD5343764.1 hypothetical protein FLA105535_03765 [Flavobacterium bizetiae]CAD5350019.1 hypothetical protein FLA105534_04006 [Flavobacterium bizetiae]